MLQEAQEQKADLAKAMKDKHVYIKMDGATRHRTNYFAINVRFVAEDHQMVTRTLAVRDTAAHHSSEYLKQLVEEVLLEYGLKKEQVLCIVSDNASNMLRTVSRLNESTQQLADEESNNSDNENDDTSLDTDDDDDDNSDYLDSVTEEASKLALIEHMRCAVHTLQLAIRDGLKDHHAKQLISKLRQVVTAARTPKIDAIL